MTQQVDVSLLNPLATGNGWIITSSDIGYVLGIFADNEIEFINGEVEFTTINKGTILGGTFIQPVINTYGTISSGTFNEEVINTYGTVSGGTFNNFVDNKSTISGGTFNRSVTNNGSISDGTFNSDVANVRATISGGTFNNFVDNVRATISGGTFNNEVTHRPGSTISGGEFYAKVTNARGTISGGEFYAGVYSDGLIKNLIAKNGFYLFGNVNAEKITIVDRGVNIDKASFDKINNIEVAKDAKVIFKNVSIKEAADKTTGEGLIQIDDTIYDTNGFEIAADISTADLPGYFDSLEANMMQDPLAGQFLNNKAFLLSDIKATYGDTIPKEELKDALSKAAAPTLAGFSASQLKSLRDNIANSVDYTKLSAQSLSDIKAIQDTAVNVDAIVEKLKAIKEIITIIKDTFIDYTENKNAQNTDLELIAQSQNSNDNLL